MWRRPPSRHVSSHLRAPGMSAPTQTLTSPRGPTVWAPSLPQALSDPTSDHMVVLHTWEGGPRPPSPEEPRGLGKERAAAGPPGPQREVRPAFLPTKPKPPAALVCTPRSLSTRPKAGG